MVGSQSYVAYLSKMDMLKIAVLKRVHEPLVAERGIGF